MPPRKRTKKTKENVPETPEPAVEESAVEEPAVEEPTSPVASSPPTDFAMSLGEFGTVRDLKPSILAGLKAFLKGDARDRKLSAWDEALNRFLKT